MPNLKFAYDKTRFRRTAHQSLCVLHPLQNASDKCALKRRRFIFKCIHTNLFLFSHYCKGTHIETLRSTEEIDVKDHFKNIYPSICFNLIKSTGNPFFSFYGFNPILSIPRRNTINSLMVHNAIQGPFKYACAR